MCVVSSVCPRLSLYRSSSMNSPVEPDADAIKMFVGQIPRTMNEDDLREMFEEFGIVCHLNVLRDKKTGESKGCCFVTMATRAQALEAQCKLHNAKIMKGMHNPVQMKPADQEKRSVEERKLFVGMISKKNSENEVRTMFSPFGIIEECTVLRDQSGQSKGCAFVTYSTKQSAQTAIQMMHHSQTQEGCSSPMVVKLADTQKDKEAKKVQTINNNLWPLPTLGGVSNLTPAQYLALLQQTATGGNVGAMTNVGNLGLNSLTVQQLLASAAAASAAASSNPGLASILAGLGTALQQANTNPRGDVNGLQSLQNVQNLAALAGLNGSPSALNSVGLQSPVGLQSSMGLPTSAGVTAGLQGSTMGLQNLAALNQLASVTNASSLPTLNGISSSAAATHGLGATTPISPTYIQGTMVSSSSPLTSMTALNSLASGTIPSMTAVTPNMAAATNLSAINGATSLTTNPTSMDTLNQAFSGIQQYAASFPGAFANQATLQLQATALASPAGKQTEGPDGANLFIYHLPADFTDQDLLSSFLAYGNIVSAKVFIDKQTNLSKCFGFVSYDNPKSAQMAIAAMNGFQIGVKRLKVQLKRQRSDNKPYSTNRVT